MQTTYSFKLIFPLHANTYMCTSTSTCISTSVSNKTFVTSLSHDHHIANIRSNKSTITDKQEKEHSNQLKNSTVCKSFKYCKCKQFLHLMSPCFYMYCISVSNNLVILKNKEKTNIQIN